VSLFEDVVISLRGETNTHRKDDCESGLVRFCVQKKHEDSNRQDDAKGVPSVFFGFYGSFFWFQFCVSFDFLEALVIPALLASAYRATNHGKACNYDKDDE